MNHDWKQIDWTDGDTTWECRLCGASDLGPSPPESTKNIQFFDIITGDAMALDCGEYIAWKVLEQ